MRVITFREAHVQSHVVRLGVNLNVLCLHKTHDLLHIRHLQRCKFPVLELQLDPANSTSVISNSLYFSFPLRVRNSRVQLYIITREHQHNDIMISW